MKRLIPVLILLAACAHRVEPTATATLDARSGSTATGTVAFFNQADGSVRVRIDITGVAPGVHGFHVHEKGDCSAADAMSAGAHFNPTSAPHAGPDDSMHHAGDFGNVTADATGEIHTEFVARSITLDSAASSAVGRAVVLHADPDDLTSQPAGNAGKRIACGVVRVAGAMQ